VSLGEALAIKINYKITIWANPRSFCW